MARALVTATISNLSLGQIGDLVVPVPSIAAQRRIAHILDTADTIRRKRREAMALTEDLLRSAFLEMFGDPVTNRKGWPVTPFDEVVHDGTGGNSKVQQADYQAAGEFPIIDQGTEFVGGWTSNRELVGLQAEGTTFGRIFSA